MPVRARSCWGAPQDRNASSSPSHPDLTRRRHLPDVGTAGRIALFGLVGFAAGLAGVLIGQLLNEPTRHTVPAIDLDEFSPAGTSPSTTFTSEAGGATVAPPPTVGPPPLPAATTAPPPTTAGPGSSPAPPPPPESDDDDDLGDEGSDDDDDDDGDLDD